MQPRVAVRYWLLFPEPHTPIGPLWIGVAVPGGWARVHFGVEPPATSSAVPWQRVMATDPRVARYHHALVQYLAGETAVPAGPWVWRFSPFRRAVYQATQRIPRGETRTYGQIAAAIGRPRAARAVGQALAHNPIPLVVPCHRVLAADGSLRGFSAPQGLALKARLLAWERDRSTA